MPPDLVTTQPPDDRAARPGVGRAYLGLALIGWGLSMVLGVTPHEDPLVGAGLAIFGLALAATSPRLPEFPGLPPWTVAAVGISVVAVVIGYTTAAGTAFDVPKTAMVLLGLGLAVSARFLGRRLKVGRKGRSITVASLVVACLAVLGAPLAVWGLQAVTKGIVGTTPIEAFVRYALIVPLGLFLRGIGFDPTIDGQIITYGTPRGPLALEVGAACSGIQAMALFTGVLALFLWTEKPGGRRLAVWSLIGIGGVYIANLIRLAVLTLVGYQWGTAALLRTHAELGWMFFVAWALIFAWLARRTSRAARPTL